MFQDSRSLANSDPIFSNQMKIVNRRRKYVNTQKQTTEFSALDV